ncbi:hypothetical protein ACFFRR_000592 [Megaselia abdita]
MLVKVFLSLIALAAYLWFRIKKQFSFFERLNVPYDKKESFFGSMTEVLFKRLNMYDMVEVMYNKYDSSVAGFFELFSPFFLIRSPELINQILVGGFPHFMNHRDVFTGDHSGLMSTSLHSMNDQKWKDMRATLTPAFTGAKLRGMFDLIRETAEEGVLNLKEEIKQEKDVDVKDFFTRYACDVIATTGFGFKLNSMKEKQNPFFQMGKDVTNFGKFALFKFIAFLHLPRLTNLLKVSLLPRKHTIYYKTLVLGTMKQRCERKIFRPDMINMLMEARGIDILGSNDLKCSNKWTDDEIVAQALFFFFSGFESVASVLCFISQELMENPEVQEKVKKEIRSVLKELNGDQLTYEVLKGMKYLDCVISEALRKWPINASTDRVCTKPIEIQDPETGEFIKIEAGDKIMIPIVGLHRDPKYYPDPMKFDPERFNDENKHNINPNTYLPFGIGPRMCIAHRFAFMEIKTMLFYMFSDFKVELSDKSSIPLKLDPAITQPHPKNGFWVRLLNEEK